MARHDWVVLIRSPLSVIVLSLALYTMAAPAARSAWAATPVETFVQQNVDQGIGILKDNTLSDAGRHAEVHALLTNLIDARRIGLFALGTARDKASEADLDAYIDAFKAFMVASYESRLDGYGGQSLKVTGVIARAPGDDIVTTVLVDSTSPKNADPVQILFRVLNEDGKFAVVDASISGVWLGLAQRDDFGGFLSQHGGSVPALTAHLKDMTAHLSVPKTAATPH